MAYEPEAGDIVWADFDPSLGREQGGRRPALVMSEHAFWKISGIAIVCPITSKIRPFPSSAVLPPNLPIRGEILTGQIRSLDTIARPFTFSGTRIPAEMLAEVRAKLALLVGIRKPGGASVAS